MELYKERNADQKREKTNLFIGAVRRYAGRTKEQIALAYAFFLVRDKYEDMPDVSVVMSYAEDDINIKDFLEENLGEGFVEAYQNVYRKYNKNDFAEIFLKLVTDDERMGLRSGYCTTPDSVINLAKTVLEIKPKERVLDLGCGKGKFCFSANADTPTAIYRGVDYDASCFNYAQMIKKVTGSNVSFSCENIFTLCEQQEKYDKVFADLPFAANVNSQGGESEYRKELSKKDPAFLKCAKLDWLYCALAMDMTMKTGRTAVMLPNGTMYNLIDQNVREYFIRNGLIEALIFLPEKMYEGMGLSVTMAVLSQGNEKIKLIDARGMFDAGRRTNTFSEKHIEEIKRLVKSEESQERCKIVTLADVERNNFSLDINRYIDSARTYKNSVSLGEIAENISRGAGCRAAELDAITSQTATPYQYLMLGDIVDGFISDDLPYITEIPKGNNRYTLKKGDIIISKMASPTKVAIVEEDYRTILASGNLYIIRLKNDTINPYFLKAYFESADGIAAISRICVGTAVPAIPVSELKQLQIPLLDKEKENEIVQKYMIAADEIKMLKRRLEKVKSSISSLFEEVE